MSVTEAEIEALAGELTAYAMEHTPRTKAPQPEHVRSCPGFDCGGPMHYQYTEVLNDCDLVVYQCLFCENQSTVTHYHIDHLLRDELAAVLRNHYARIG